MKRKNGGLAGIEAAEPSRVPVARKPQRKPITLRDIDAFNAARNPPESDYGRIAGMRERAYSSKSLRPDAASAISIRKVMGEQIGHTPDLTPEALADELADQCAAVASGNMERPEAMLLSQAQTLDAIFHQFIQQAYDDMRDIGMVERRLRVAFRAQSQSRACLETLAYLKSPPMVFAKQANLTTGPQQVNNNGLSHARETEFFQNELLEQRDGKRLEPGAAGGAGGRDSEMAAMAGLYRAKDRRGEG